MDICSNNYSHNLYHIFYALADKANRKSSWVKKKIVYTVWVLWFHEVILILAWNYKTWHISWKTILYLPCVLCCDADVSDESVWDEDDAWGLNISATRLAPFNSCGVSSCWTSTLYSTCILCDVCKYKQ